MAAARFSHGGRKLVTVSPLAYLCALFLILGRGSADTESLYLLNVVPYPDPLPGADWALGKDVAVAAHIAEEQINNRSDLLPGYKLRVLDVDSEACGRSIIVKGLANVYRHLVNSDLPVVGVTGLLCSTVTDVLAPILGHPGVDYVMLAGSTSPRHRITTLFPRLFHAISSAEVYNDAMIELMEKFKWRQIGLVYDSLGIFFFSTAMDFIRKSYEAGVTTVPKPITSQSHEMSSLPQRELRVIYAIMTAQEAAKLVCGAYKEGVAYTFIFIERTLDEIVNQTSNTTCSENEIRKGMEGALLLYYQLNQFDITKVLESGLTYEGYRDEYVHRTESMKLQNSSYGAVQYDQVWAFALALNRSLRELDSINASLSSYNLGNRQITDIIMDNLANVSFEGATGTVQFGTTRETQTSVEFFQVTNRTNESTIRIATYSPYDIIMNRISLTEEGIAFHQKMPRDRFRSVFVTVPTWLATIIFTISGLVMLLTTVILILFVYWRHRPEIKATSPYLSLCMFVGCYMLSLATLVRTIQQSNLVEREMMFVAVCYLDIWLGSLGFLLIFGTLLVRLLRIYHVFTHFGKTSRFWRDHYLFLEIMAICFVNILVLAVWIPVDPIERAISEDYIPTTPQPYYRALAMCSSQFITLWLTLLFAFNGLIVLVVSFLAIQTRHIKQVNFKDTKKVTIFVFSVMFTLPILLTFWIVFSQINHPIASHIAFCVAFLSVPTLCQLFIFVPKTIPGLKRTNKYHSMRHVVSQWTVGSIRSTRTQSLT